MLARHERVGDETHRLCGDNRVQGIKGLEHARVLLLKVCLNSRLDDSKWVGGTPAEIHRKTQLVSETMFIPSPSRIALVAARNMNHKDATYWCRFVPIFWKMISLTLLLGWPVMTSANSKVPDQDRTPSHAIRSTLPELTGLSDRTAYLPWRPRQAQQQPGL